MSVTRLDSHGPKSQSKTNRLLLISRQPCSVAISVFDLGLRRTAREKQHVGDHMSIQKADEGARA